MPSSPHQGRRRTPLALGRRLLVVDDDENTRASLRGILEAEGYVVEESGDGAEALERLRVGPPPSLVLTDLEMPRVGGVALAEAMKRDDKLAGIPVVVPALGPWSGREPEQEAASPPSSLSTEIRPPRASKVPLAIARPSPTPRRPALFACQQRSKTCGSVSGEMPWPVSPTEKRWLPSALRTATLTRPPAAVNLIASPSRFGSH